MATGARGSHGTLIKIGDGGGGGEVFTTIAEVNDIDGPGIELGTEEVTSHDSGGWAEFIGTVKDGGEVSFDINYTGHATQGMTGGLYNDMANATKRNFQIVFPTSPAKTCTIAAFVTGFNPNAPVSGALRSSITLKVTGAPVWS